MNIGFGQDPSYALIGNSLGSAFGANSANQVTPGPIGNLSNQLRADFNRSGASGLAGHFPGSGFNNPNASFGSINPIGAAFGANGFNQVAPGPIGNLSNQFRLDMNRGGFSGLAGIFPSTGFFA